MEKGASTTPPAVETPDYTALTMQMNNMMGGMMEGMAGMMDAQQQAMSQYQQPALPDQYDTVPVDWAEAHANLASKAAADYGIEGADRRTSATAVMSSPLLDDEDAMTTSSILTGDINAGVS